MRFLRCLRNFVVTVVVGGLAVGACVAAVAPGATVVALSHYYTNNLLTELSDLSEVSTVYDSAGNVLDKLGIENRESVPLSEVPEILRNAVVATEDATFWTNDGIDIGAVARAALKNFTSGKIEQGGSTITQQLVKNRILTPKRDINRKVKEVLLALRINEKFTKEEILESYLNSVYFGQGSYGVKTAVERFFVTTDPATGVKRGKLLSEVSVADAATLAGVIRAPELDNPFLHPEAALARRTFVLGRMRSLGYVTKEQFDAAMKEPLPTEKPVPDLRPRSAWVEEVQDRLKNDPAYIVLGATPAAREKALLTNGLKIYTTLDPKLQQDAQNAVNSKLPTNKPGFTGALVAIDPATGAVRSMVSGPGFESSQYNIATSYPGRQAGSTWKMVTLSTAIQNGYSPNDLVDGTSPCEFGALGRTENAEGSGGFMRLAAATAGSVNCAYVRIELSLGFSRVIAMAKRLGITQGTLQPILTLTLGTIESTPLEMATIGATIAAQGIHRDPYFVQKIVNREGVTIYDAAPSGDRVLDPDAASCVTELMKGVVTGGTGTGARIAGRDVAGKTGTTDRRADAWFVGFTPQLAAAVWHGNIDGQVPGAGFGGGIPASIWKAFMEAALDGQPAIAFPPARCPGDGQLITESGRQAIPADFQLDGSGQPIPPTTTLPKVTVKKPASTSTTKPTPTTKP